jgi:hypothetical protein
VNKIIEATNSLFRQITELIGKIKLEHIITQENITGRIKPYGNSIKPCILNKNHNMFGM